MEIQISKKSTKTTTEETFNWVHITIGNTKHNFTGNYRRT